MTGLLIDSSNNRLTVGISVDKRIIDFIDEEAWQRQSELLVSSLDELLKKHNIKRQDISYVVASKGPGSYTGVRIGLTVAKVIAFALNVPLYLSSSLEVLQDRSAPSICVSNARSKRSYVGVYFGEEAIVEDTIWSNEDLLLYIKEHPSYKVCGEIEYLGLSAQKPDVLSNLNESNTEKNLQKDVLSAKPVYLKDNY